MTWRLLARPQARWVVVKAEANAQGTNRRFIVTNRPGARVLPEAAYDGEPHALGMMMRSFVDACLRGELDGDVDPSFHDGLAAQQGLAAVACANADLAWAPLADT